MHRSTRELLAELRAIHRAIRPDIERQLARFKAVWRDGSDEDIFCELVFCLFTPQSSAHRCWNAVEILKANDLVLRGRCEEISERINMVRFRNNKAIYLVKAREQFSNNGEMRIKSILDSRSDVFERRNFLASNVKGMGWKEASHFLRNTGFGANLAILDRHVLKNLVLLGVIPDIPASLTLRRYLYIEERMRAFAKKIRIPLAHLDFVLWFREAGDVFK
ncbi:MAG TPA: N-glycosylase/DNA lyase [Spirochaetota bacterium]|nr:N-glycosylase/DNA lyase [Spirochaetota bacterium]